MNEEELIFTQYKLIHEAQASAGVWNRIKSVMPGSVQGKGQVALTNLANRYEKQLRADTVKYGADYKNLTPEFMQTWVNNNLQINPATQQQFKLVYQPGSNQGEFIKQALTVSNQVKAGFAAPVQPQAPAPQTAQPPQQPVAPQPKQQQTPDNITFNDPDRASRNTQQLRSYTPAPRGAAPAPATTAPATTAPTGNKLSRKNKRAILQSIAQAKGLPISQVQQLAKGNPLLEKKRVKTLEIDLVTESISLIDAKNL